MCAVRRRHLVREYAQTHMYRLCLSHMKYMPFIYYNQNHTKITTIHMRSNAGQNVVTPPKDERRYLLWSIDLNQSISIELIIDRCETHSHTQNILIQINHIFKFIQNDEKKDYIYIPIYKWTKTRMKWESTASITVTAYTRFSLYCTVRCIHYRINTFYIY